MSCPLRTPMGVATRNQKLYMTGYRDGFSITPPDKIRRERR